MMKNHVSAETRMKAAVIDRLLSGGHVTDDAVLISEMTVANWTRRADIVLANGKLCAFELKSETDNLSRLSGQLATFASQFEKLIVVVAARFEKHARPMLPEGVGLWVEGEEGIFKERVRPKALPLSKEAAISLMTATDLRSLLACNGVRDIKDAYRQRLEEIVLAFPATDIVSAARNAVKRRYRRSHRAFLDQRAHVGTLGAMQSLRRFSSRGTIEVEAPELNFPLPEVKLSDDHPLLLRAPAGLVLKRKVPRFTLRHHRPN